MNGYIRRGLLGSTISSHNAAGLFMRLDNTIFKYTYDPTWAGQTLYFKFLSFNAFNNSLQRLEDVVAVPFTVPGLNQGTVEAGSGLVLLQQPVSRPLAIIPHAIIPPIGIGRLGWAEVTLPMSIWSLQSINVTPLTNANVSPGGSNNQVFSYELIVTTAIKVTSVLARCSNPFTDANTFSMGIYSMDGTIKYLAANGFVRNSSVDQTITLPTPVTLSAGTYRVAYGSTYAPLEYWYGNSAGLGSTPNSVNCSGVLAGGNMPATLGALVGNSATEWPSFELIGVAVS
jgi:hypothetical protein